MTEVIGTSIKRPHLSTVNC